MILFLSKHHLNSYLTIFAIIFRVQFYPKKVSFVIFKYGGAQYEWSSSLNRSPPKFSSFFSLFQNLRYFWEENEQYKSWVDTKVNAELISWSERIFFSLMFYFLRRNWFECRFYASMEVNRPCWTMILGYFKDISPWVNA